MEAQLIEKIVENSSQVDKLSYKGDTLTVTYKGSKQYEYYKVPKDVQEALYAAESAGKFISREIKGKFNFKFIG